MWGGRFSEAQDPLMEKFNESLSFDRRMWREDVDGSVGYAAALARAGVITGDERDAIVSGLRDVAKEWEADAFEAKAGDEDIHTANERRLTELIGDVAGKLHTGRSRNDQVATDTRMWLRKELIRLRGYLRTLIEVAVDRAEREVDVVMPEVLHLQSAQTVAMVALVALARRGVAERRSAIGRSHQARERHAARVRRARREPVRDRSSTFGQGFGIRRRVPEFHGRVSDRDALAEAGFWASMTATHLRDGAKI